MELSGRAGSEADCDLDDRSRINFPIIPVEEDFSLRKASGDNKVTPLLVAVGLSGLISLIKDGKISCVNFYPDGRLVGSIK